MDELDVIDYTDPEFTPLKKPERRRNLLPWWIKTFSWMFILFCLLVPVGVVFGLLKREFDISLLGLSTGEPISAMGLFLMALFVFKGVIAFGLWTEKNWAVGLAKIDAILSLLVCLAGMGYSFFGPDHSFSFRFEVIILCLYYYRVDQLQYDWENFDNLEFLDPFVSKLTID
jgi:hypothetical protein